MRPGSVSTQFTVHNGPSRGDEIGQDLRRAAEEDEVAVVGVVASSDAWESPFLVMGHGDGVISVEAPVPDEGFGLDVFETKSFPAGHRDAVPGCRSDPLPEAFGEARAERVAADA